MLGRILSLFALLGLLVGNSTALGGVVAGAGEDCECSEIASDSCCVVLEPSCCEEDEIPEGATRWTTQCGCGKHAPTPTLPGGGPFVPVDETSDVCEVTGGELPRELADQVVVRMRSAPELPPPRVQSP